MTFNPNTFDAYDTNLIVNSLWFYLDNHHTPPYEWDEHRNQITEIVNKLINN